MSRNDLNRANLNTLTSQLDALKLGNALLGQLPQSKRKINPSALGVGAGNLATLHALQQPDWSPASTVVRATVRAGGVTGELTPVAYGVTPTTGQIAVGPNGQVVVLASDAITDMDLHYLPERGDVLSAVFPVVSNVLTLPTSAPWMARGVVLLLEVEALTATLTGKKIVLIPGAGAPAAGQARLNLAKTTVTFQATDAVTRARVKLLVGQSADLQTVLNEVDQYQ